MKVFHYCILFIVLSAEQTAAKGPRNDGGGGGGGRVSICERIGSTPGGDGTLWQTTSVKPKDIGLYESQGHYIISGCTGACTAICPDNQGCFDDFVDGVVGGVESCICYNPSTNYKCGPNTECSGDLCTCSTGFKELAFGDASSGDAGCCSTACGPGTECIQGQCQCLPNHIERNPGDLMDPAIGCISCRGGSFQECPVDIPGWQPLSNDPDAQVVNPAWNIDLNPADTIIDLSFELNWLGVATTTSLVANPDGSIFLYADQTFTRFGKGMPVTGSWPGYPRLAICENLYDLRIPGGNVYYKDTGYSIIFSWEAVTWPTVNAQAEIFSNGDVFWSFGPTGDLGHYSTSDEGEIAVGIEHPSEGLIYPVLIDGFCYPLTYGQGGWAGLCHTWPANEKQCFFLSENLPGCSGA